MVCKKCGCPISDTAAFCEKCGAPIEKKDTNNFDKKSSFLKEGEALVKKFKDNKKMQAIFVAVLVLIVSCLFAGNFLGKSKVFGIKNNMTAAQVQAVLGKDIEVEETGNKLQITKENVKYNGIDGELYVFVEDDHVKGVVWYQNDNSMIKKSELNKMIGDMTKKYGENKVKPGGANTEVYIGISDDWAVHMLTMSQSSFIDGSDTCYGGINIYWTTV